MNLQGLQRAPTQDFEVVTDDDRRLARANGALFERLQALLHGKTMTQPLYERMINLIYDHRVECITRGIAYPHVTAVWLDGVRVVKVLRTDIEARDLQVAMINWTREHPDVTAAEIARAIAKHFPWYVGQVNSEMAN